MNGSGPAPQTTASLTQNGVNTGQIAVGTNIRQTRVDLTVNLSAGDPAAIGRLNSLIAIEPLPRPVRPAVRDFAALLGRDAELGVIAEATTMAPVVAAFGADGLGKTVLLRHLAHRPPPGAWPDGVVHLAGRGLFWEDLAGELLRAFNRVGQAAHLGRTVLAEHLGPLEALVVVDDVSPAADIDQLVGLAARSTFVLASSEPIPVVEARSMRLEGIAPAAVPELVQRTRELAGAVRALEPDETAAAARLGALLRRGVAVGADPGVVHDRLCDIRRRGGSSMLSPYRS
jgi:hypothetical protein